MEDILREVIVISDDEDEPESEEEVDKDRENSIEFISSQAVADDIHVQPLDFDAMDHSNSHSRRASSEDNYASGIKLLRRVNDNRRPRHYQEGVDRQRAHRHRVWQEAVKRRQSSPSALHAIDIQEQASKPDDLDHRRQEFAPVLIALRPADTEYGQYRPPAQPLYMLRGGKQDQVS